QVWNMTLSFYQSLKNVPFEYHEAASMYQLNAWQRFWHVEVPFAIPGLLWNTMVSMSASWFFVVASEAISVSNQQIHLPGIGSYISLAIEKGNLQAIGFASVTMFIVILIYDQLIFRPLLKWAERFKTSNLTEDNLSPESWFYDLLTKTRLIKKINYFIDYIVDKFINLPLIKKSIKKPKPPRTPIGIQFKKYIPYCWYLFLFITLIITSFYLISFIKTEIEFSEVKTVLYLGLITGFKVTLLVLLSSFIWIPVGVWIGLNPKATQIFQPLAQFLAAFPVNLIYPIFVFLILHYQLNVDIWTSPLMILGTQWYILFNVIAGTSQIPQELKIVAKNFGLKGWLWWRRLILPAIFPYYLTGAMAATGGCWNASIVADCVKWGDTELIAQGLGSYITHYTVIGDFPRIALGISVMSLYVMLSTRLIWQRMYKMSQRFTIG
ncbi:MAG: transporter permease subunit, partial [Francisellaceae bacterium]|nr:transporter permease subunit [Francisellaceae bacterium]